MSRSSNVRRLCVSIGPGEHSYSCRRGVGDVAARERLGVWRTVLKRPKNFVSVAVGGGWRRLCEGQECDRQSQKR